MRLLEGLLRDQAWTVMPATDLEDLANNYKAISSAYWKSEEHGTLSNESWDKARKGFVDIVKIIDDMKAMV